MENTVIETVMEAAEVVAENSEVIDTVVEATNDIAEVAQKTKMSTGGKITVGLAGVGAVAIIGTAIFGGIKIVKTIKKKKAEKAADIVEFDEDDFDDEDIDFKED